MFPTLAATPEADLAAVAFGAEPGRWPLPPATDPDQLWLRAVAAGGQGRYATARNCIAEVIRRAPRGRLGSLALSTQASFLRQLGWHRLARGWDGRAYACAGADSEAGVDALIGLSADALGVGRLAASGALLHRAADLLAGADSPPPRLAIRLAWVRAELAMAGGDGPAAVRHARAGVELAASAPPALRRHRVKSDVVLAAALCSAGDRAAARALADTALADTETHGLIPLRWALSCLLADIGSRARHPADIEAIRDHCAAFAVRHGGRWNSR
jgi:hypothetical protein